MISVFKNLVYLKEEELEDENMKKKAIGFISKTVPVPIAGTTLTAYYLYNYLKNRNKDKK